MPPHFNTNPCPASHPPTFTDTPRPDRPHFLPPFYLFIFNSKSMPTAVQKSIPAVRSPSYYGLKNQKNNKVSKPQPAWVDVSDEDSKKKSLKRKGSIVNGQHEHSTNGHKQKKRRHSVRGAELPQVNGAGPSHVNGARATTLKAKLLQEQRTQLPIAKGPSAVVGLLVKSNSSGTRKRRPYRRNSEE